MGKLVRQTLLFITMALFLLACKPEHATPIVNQTTQTQAQPVQPEPAQQPPKVPDTELEERKPDLVENCPPGTTDHSACRAECSGSCELVTISEAGSCFACIEQTCPTGFYDSPSLCDAACDGGCVATQTSAGTCHECRKSCDQVCEDEGYSAQQIDHSAYIESALNRTPCVSGASIRVPERIQMNECLCYGTRPVIEIDDSQLSCDTQCGIVECGNEVTCQKGDSLITVSCEWQGWQKIGKYQYRPEAGVS